MWLWLYDRRQAALGHRFVRYEVHGGCHQVVWGFISGCKRHTELSTCAEDGGKGKWTPPDFEKYGNVTFYTDKTSQHYRNTTHDWFNEYMIGISVVEGALLQRKLTQGPPKLKVLVSVELNISFRRLGSGACSNPGVGGLCSVYDAWPGLRRILLLCLRPAMVLLLCPLQ